MSPDHKQKIAELARKFAWELANPADTSDYHARGWNSANAGFQAGAEAYAALHASDAAEIERVKADAEDWKAIANSHRNGAHLSIWDRTKYEDQLATERQVRQAAEARMKKLEACLEEISRYPSGTHGSAELARNALAPLREEEAKSKCPPNEPVTEPGEARADGGEGESCGS